MRKMQTYNVSEELNRTFGAPGTESRKEAENQAWEEYACIPGEMLIN